MHFSWKELYFHFWTKLKYYVYPVNLQFIKLCLVFDMEIIHFVNNVQGTWMNVSQN